MTNVHILTCTLDVIGLNRRLWMSQSVGRVPPPHPRQSSDEAAAGLWLCPHHESSVVVAATAPWRHLAVGTKLRSGKCSSKTLNSKLGVASRTSCRMRNEGEKKVRNAGIEPATCGFGIRRSTTELIPRDRRILSLSFRVARGGTKIGEVGYRTQYLETTRNEGGASEGSWACCGHCHCSLVRGRNALLLL